MSLDSKVEEGTNFSQLDEVVCPLDSAIESKSVSPVMNALAIFRRKWAHDPTLGKAAEELVFGDYIDPEVIS